MDLVSKETGPSAAQIIGQIAIGSAIGAVIGCTSVIAERCYQRYKEEQNGPPPIRSSIFPDRPELGKLPRCLESIYNINIITLSWFII